MISQNHEIAECSSKEETQVAFTMNPLNFAIFSSSLLISAQCSLICPDVTTKPDFDPSRYLGDWYQMEGTVAFFAPEGSHCIRATYGDRGDGTVSVHNVVTKEGKSPNEICGYATIPDIDNEPGRLAVYFPDVPVAGDYRILDTDYENWAAVYSCSNFDIFGLFRYTYLLTRSQSRNESAIAEAKEVYKNQGVPMDKFVVFPSGPDCSYEVPNSCAKN